MNLSAFFNFERVFISSASNFN